MDQPLKITAIAAMDKGRVIGMNNQIPWHLPDDLKRFSQLTKGHTVLMGRKTYFSLPPAYRPLPGRKNIVLSRHASELKLPAEVEVWSSADEFFSACKTQQLVLPSKLLWVIGGEQVYKATMRYWDELRLTLVDAQYRGDSFFPCFEDAFELVSIEKHDGYSVQLYAKRAPGKDSAR